MTRIRYKEYPCGNHRSNHVFINDGDIGSDYYRIRIVPPSRGFITYLVQITNSKEKVIKFAAFGDLRTAKGWARTELLNMGAQLFDEVRRSK